MSTNTNLHKANVIKNDEFYTRFTDISKELINYKKHFKDKVILCNCDNPNRSAFWKYFHLNFNKLGLKKLISTYYNKDKSTYKIEYRGGNDNDIKDSLKIPLKCNGDFRNVECIKILKEADIVVTNPPFSLFREYITMLMEYNKKFIIIGNINSVTYKEFFPLLKDDKVWVGCNKPLVFDTPNGIPKKIQCRWFTNLDHQKRHRNISLCKKYIETDYKTFDELPNIINVNKIKDIPADYYGYMGVPITFFDNYNPEQFEVVDGLNRYTFMDYFGINKDVKKRHSHCCNVNGKPTYYRVIIRKKKYKTK